MDELVADLVAAHEEIARVPVRLTKKELDQALKSFFVRTQLVADAAAANPRAGIIQLGSPSQQIQQQQHQGNSPLSQSQTPSYLTSLNRHLIQDPLASGFQPPYFADHDNKSTENLLSPFNGSNPILMRNLWTGLTPLEVSLLTETCVAVIYAPGQKVYGRTAGELTEVQVGCMSGSVQEYSGDLTTPGPITQSTGITVPRQIYQLTGSLTAPGDAKYMGVILHGALDEFIQFGEGRCATRLGVGSIINPDLILSESWTQSTSKAMGIVRGDVAASFITSFPGGGPGGVRGSVRMGSVSSPPSSLNMSGSGSSSNGGRGSISGTLSSTSGGAKLSTYTVVLHIPLPVIKYFAREALRNSSQIRDTTTQVPFSVKFTATLDLAQYQTVTDAAFRLAPKLWQGGRMYAGVPMSQGGVGMPSIRAEMYRRTLQALSEGGKVSPDAVQELQAVQRQYAITSMEHEAAMSALGLSEEDWNRFKAAWLTAHPEGGRYGRRPSGPFSTGVSSSNSSSATDLRARNNDMLIRQLHRDMYTRALEVFLEDGVITAEERIEVERLRVQYALTDADHDEALARLGKTREEYDKMVEIGIQHESSGSDGSTSTGSSVEHDPAVLEALHKAEASRAAREKAALATSLMLTRERANQLDVYKRVLATFLADSEIPPAVLSEIEFVRSQCHLTQDDHNQCLAELGFTPEQFAALVEAGADADYLSRLDRSGGGGANLRVRELTLQNKLVEKERSLARQLEEEKKRSNKYLQNSLSRTVQLENARRFNTELQSKVRELEKEIELGRNRDQESGQSYAVMRKSMEAMLEEIEAYRDRERALEEKVQNANIDLTQQTTILAERYLTQIREMELMAEESKREYEKQVAKWRFAAEGLEKAMKRSQRLNRKEVEELQREVQSYKDLVAEISGTQSKLWPQSSSQQESDLEAELSATKHALRLISEESDELRLKLEHEAKRSAQLETLMKSRDEKQTKLQETLDDSLKDNIKLKQRIRHYRIVVKYCTIMAWKKVCGARKCLQRVFQSVSELVADFIRDIESGTGPGGRVRAGSSSEEQTTEKRQRELKISQAKEEPLLILCASTEEAVHELVAMFDSYRKYILEWKNISQEFFQRSMELAKERETTSTSLNHATQAIHAMLEEDNTRAKQVQELLARAVDIENTRKEMSILRRRVRVLEEANKKLELRCQSLSSTSAALQELVTPYSVSVPDFLLKRDKGPTLPPYLVDVDSNRVPPYDALVNSSTFKVLQRQRYKEQESELVENQLRKTESQSPSKSQAGKHGTALLTEVVPPAAGPIHGGDNGSALIQGHILSLSERGKVNPKELHHLTKSTVTYLKPNVQQGGTTAPGWQKKLQRGLDIGSGSLSSRSAVQESAGYSTLSARSEQRPLRNAGMRRMDAGSKPSTVKTKDTQSLNEDDTGFASRWASDAVYSLPTMFSELTLNMSSSSK